MKTATAIKSIVSSSVGNILEWYEYTLYAYFSTVIRGSKKTTISTATAAVM
jgi:hypothetical protein